LSRFGGGFGCGCFTRCLLSFEGLSLRLPALQVRVELVVLFLTDPLTLGIYLFLGEKTRGSGASLRGRASGSAFRDGLPSASTAIVFLPFG